MQKRLLLAVLLSAFVAPAHAQSQEADDCPIASTLEGRMRIADGELSCDELAKRAIPPRPISPAEQRRIIAHFDNVLVDGPSARWRWNKVVRGSIACFVVNARNRMGGYSGWSRYSFNLETGEETNLEELDALLERLGMEKADDLCS